MALTRRADLTTSDPSQLFSELMEAPGLEAADMDSLDLSVKSPHRISPFSWKMLIFVSLAKFSASTPSEEIEKEN